LDVAIAGDAVTAQIFSLNFNWTGNWQTSFLHSQGRIQQLNRNRTISDDQAGKIIDKLKGLKLRPLMVTTRQGAREDDPEAHEYAVQVKKVLSQAGVTINEAAVGLGTLFPIGVSIFAKPNLYNDVTVSAIIDAIRLTGVECKTRQRQVWYGNGIEPEINLIIGANEITPPS